MPPRFASILALLIVAIFIGSNAEAQDAAERNVQQLQMAEAFMRGGQYDRAVVLLEQLYSADPTSFVVFDRLRTAYENVKRYDDAISLTNTRLRESATPVLQADIARYHHLAGDEREAEQLWQRAIALAPNQRSTYHVVYRSMLDVRRLDLAIETLRQGRQALRDDSAFRGELATLLGMVGRFDEAMDENIAVLRDDPRQLAAITSRLGRITEQPEALASAVSKTERAVRADPLQRQLRELLSWLYVEAGDYDGAFEESRAIDRLENQEGRLVLAFAQRAIDAGAFDAARKAYEHVIAQHGNASPAVHAKIGLAAVEKARADSASEAGDHDAAREHSARALDHYREFLAAHPAHQSEPQILVEVGSLELAVSRDLPAASAAFEQVMNRHAGTAQADEAQLELGRIEVLRGDLESARLQFGRIVDRLRIGDLAERARFEIALIHYYRGEFEAARAMTDVLDVNTSTDVANDAIELKVVMSDNRGPDSLNTPLRRYAEAQLLIRQHRLDDALAVLGDLLSTFGRHRIADEARFARAEALYASGEVQPAFDAFTEVTLYHPESHLADRALFEAAGIQYRRLGDPDAAIETLTRLLREYPGSLVAAESRQMIRRLRGDAL
jgi:cellulose synthase operon protein C